MSRNVIAGTAVLVLFVGILFGCLHPSLLIKQDCTEAELIFKVHAVDGRLLTEDCKYKNGVLTVGGAEPYGPLNTWRVADSSIGRHVVKAYNIAGQLSEDYIDSGKGGCDGSSRMWRESGVLFHEMHCANNTLNGLQSFFHENGAPFSTQEYRNGMEHGNFKTYDDRGQVIFHRLYRNGVLIEVVSMLDEFDRENVLPPGEIDCVWKFVPTVNATNVYVAIRVPEDARRLALNDHRLLASKIDHGFVVDILDDQGTHYHEIAPLHYRAQSYSHAQDDRASALEHVENELVLSDNSVMRPRFKVGEIVKASAFRPDVLYTTFHSDILVHLYKDLCHFGAPIDSQPYEIVS